VTRRSRASKPLQPAAAAHQREPSAPKTPEPPLPPVTRRAVTGSPAAILSGLRPRCVCLVRSSGGSE
jgi:hypothetical protein